jgi:hypothetical protein
MQDEEFQIVGCPPCLVCGKQALVRVRTDAYEAWKAGTHVQFAFPDAPADVRELLITGTHPDCWKTLWEEEES